MPTHIKMFRKNSDPQLSMAKSALSRAIKGYPSDRQDPIVKVVDGVIEYLRVPKTMTIYDYSWVPCNPKCGDEVEFETLGKTRSQIEAAKVFLRRRGFRCVRKGVYRYGPEDLTERADAVH